ncbi:GntR family transcriptional regulator [Parvibium lacunae]|uniref:GntR family transcriptional regulator n=1 Tax=Parvibium lacunae TaxID=1888893 RepID=A0A368L6M5_9BURK|nr:GntR family transcriptional regulator [Parvibium lacunae]RCS59276.1 GntR family transcriptional regulator [Parvibium lacunae]
MNSAGMSEENKPVGSDHSANKPASSVGSAVAASASADTSAPVTVYAPLYQQIKGLITQGLQAGEWRPGEMIPSEMELAKRYGVSQGTVRKAVDDLATEHILIRRQGKGTFVATHHEEKVSFRFLRLVPDEGEPTYPQSQFLACKRMRATPEVADSLALATGDAVILVKRILYLQERPTVLEEIWLPGLQFKGLTAERLAAYKGPMYGLFETEFGTRMIRASEKIRAVAADQACAESLKVTVGTPLLLVERVAFTYGDQAVEWRRGFYRTDHHAYRNELS